MNRVTKILGSLLLAIMLAIGCAEDGEPGPQGEEGIRGEQGEPGAANVIYSDWLDSEFGSGGNYSLYLLAEIDNNLTSTNTAVFLVYCKEEPSDIVNPLPMQLDQTIYSFYVVPPRSETPTISRIFLYRDGTPPENLPLGRAIPTHFRYVVIPGGVPASAGRTINYTDMDYNEIKARFNIPD